MSDEQMTTVRDFIAENKITLTAEYADRNPNMIDGADNMDHWRCVLRHGSGDQRRTMTTYFSMGMGHNGKEPTAADILDCLASDSSSIENARGFEDWARDFGYDTDSRKAERIYKACERAAQKLKNFLGKDAYDTLLWKTERL